MASYSEMFHKSIRQSFEQFHKDNPHIYSYFCQFATDWIKTGVRKISSKQIVGRIRWHLEVETGGDEAAVWKVNDAFTAYYSRLFVSDFPEYSELFEFRGLRAA